VPDADDTPGAILALKKLWEELDARLGASNWMKTEFEALFGYVPELPFGAYTREASAACMWLIKLQNRDGGWPTFCRGWGHLPFDRSGSDLTAHVMRALAISRPLLENGVHLPDETDPAKGIMIVGFSDLDQYDLAVKNGFANLARTQRPDGSWLPLWFGNQHTPDDENPTYGTARVLAAYRDLAMMDTEPARKGVAWLLANQNADGGWGGGAGSPSSIEETALVIDVLIDVIGGEPSRVSGRLRGDFIDGDNRVLTDLGSPPLNKALVWLVERIEHGGLSHPTPIGFYFAKLWYFEKLYPIIFSVSALGRARKSLQTRTI
jgi:squalene-hopene/tetraprenyl-beta-curcumene cyclase